MSISGGPSKALERGRSIGCTAIQIFVKNNMQWFAKPFSEADLTAYHRYPDRPRMVFGHTSYLINPGARNPEFLEKSIRALTEELARADQLELPFLVLHPGAHMGDGEEAGLTRIVSSLDSGFASLPGGKCRIALEITAGQGSCLGHTFEHLAKIIESLEVSGTARDLSGYSPSVRGRFRHFYRKRFLGHDPEVRSDHRTRTSRGLAPK